ncbi:MAG: DUF4432 family protein [Rhizobiaceae bacterium]|nr:DUF4432 family protein [Rhizobiaceae bacterium]
MIPRPDRFVADLRQLAGVRRIVLDDGPERGVRALSFSTGGGLDFWVLSDRSMDIGPLWWRGVQIGWMAPGGFRSPFLADLDSDDGQGFTRSISGFLVTCGLDHIRKQDERNPLHGRFPFTPARILACGEDWDGAEPVLFCEGEVVQARLGGEALILRRRIEAPIGKATIRIRDRVENIGPDGTDHAMLYHFNLGYPAVAGGTCVYVGDRKVVGPLAVPEDEVCEPFLALRESAAQPATSILATVVTEPGFSMSLSVDESTLPWLQLWRDLRPRVGIFAMEPCTSARTLDGRSDGNVVLKSGEERRYELNLDFGGPAPAISRNDPGVGHV